MARFKIHGADEETGQAIAVEVEAQTVASARAQAFRMGMLVSRVEVLSGPEVPAEVAPDDAPQAVRETGVVVTERTSKQWKSVQLAGGLLFVLGVASCISASGMRDGGDIGGADSLMQVAVLGLTIGPVVWLIGRLSAWWHHG